jgi:hypothetical protein
MPLACHSERSEGSDDLMKNDARELSLREKVALIGEGFSVVMISIRHAFAHRKAH